MTLLPTALVLWMLSAPGLLDGADGADPGTQAKVEEVADDRISERIEQIFDEIEGLEDVSVDVVSGVVKLDGLAGSETRRERAVKLAEATPGVVEVVDEIEVSTDVFARLRPALANLEDKFSGFIARIPLFGVALAVFLAFAFASRFITRRTTLFQRVVRNSFVRALLRQLVGLTLMVVGAVTALEVLDATAVVGAILGTAGIVGLAIGFAFKDTVENYIASVLMTLRQPFSPNDHVVIEDQEGHVVRLTSRATILMTLDGNHVRVPNASVFKATIVNYTHNPRRRFRFDVGVGTSDDLLKATALATQTLEAMEGVMDDPAPEAHVLELGDSNVQVRVFGWVDQAQFDFLRVRSEAVRLVKTAFDDALVSMPEPTYNVRLYDEGRGFSPGEEAGPTKAPGSVEVGTVRANIRRDDNIEKQIAQEQAVEQDLLDPHAKRE